MDGMIGRVLKGCYKLYDTVGVGGFASVYMGRDARTNVIVAVKLLHSQFLHDPGVVKRFLAEASVVAGIRNPHIVRVLDHGQEDGSLFIIMEYVQGITLARLIESRGALPLGETMELMGQMLQGLAAAHQAGVVHRDLKPQNLMVTPQGVLKIMDFGIAKDMAVAGMTQTGAFMGTPHYMSPEQAQGLPVDHRADLYAAAVILHEMMAGRLPFDASSTWAIVHAHVSEPPPPLRTHQPDAPQGLEAVLLRALAKDPAGRFQTAAELLEALRPFGAGGAAIPHSGVSAGYPSPAPQGRPRSSGTRRIMPLLAGATAVVAVTAAVLLQGRGVAPQAAPPPPGVAQQAESTPEPFAGNVAQKIAAPVPTAPPPAPTPLTAPTATRPAPTATSQPAPPSALASVPLGRSVERRPLDALRVGNGPVRLGVVGSLHGGREAAAHGFLLQLWDRLTANPREVDPRVTLYVLPTANPDDIQKATGFNMRGVDLNRNFPPDWVSKTYARPGGRYGPTGWKEGGGGASPFSEPETQAIRTLADGQQLQGVLILNSGLSVISSRDGGGGKGEALALQLSKTLGIRYEATFTEYRVTGQMVDWVEDSGRLGVEVNMPASFSYDRGWEAVQGAIAHLAR